MPNVNQVNFGGMSNADLQMQQQELQRRQMMAEALRKQAAAPLEQQQVSGRVVKISPLEGLAKLGQAYLANKQSQDVTEKQGMLGKETAARAAGALRALAPAGVFDTPASNVTASPEMPMGQEGQTPMQQGAPMPTQPQVAPEVKDAWIRALKISETNPELGNKLVQNLAELTTDQRNNAAMGIDPRRMGRALQGKAEKDAIYEQAGGTMATNMATGTQNYLPKVAEGIQINGQGGASPVPGYAPAAAGIAGSIKRAEAAGTAGYNMTTVNTPNGPVMMTAEQAAQMSGGAQQPAPLNFTGSNGAKLNFTNSTPQQVFDSAKGDPAMLAAFAEWAQSGAAQKPPGIPLQTPAQAAQQLGAVTNDVEVDKARRLAAQTPEAQQQIKDAGSVLSLISMAEPLLDTATGSTVGNIRDKLGGVVGKSSPASEAAAQLAAVGGLLTSKMPKMSGPQSDKDVQLYKEMAGKIGDPTVPSGEKKAALKTIREINQKYLSDNKDSIANQAIQKNLNPGAAVPVIDDLLKKYGEK